MKYFAIIVLAMFSGCITITKVYPVTKRDTVYLPSYKQFQPYWSGIGNNLTIPGLISFFVTDSSGIRADTTLNPWKRTDTFHPVQKDTLKKY